MEKAWQHRENGSRNRFFVLSAHMGTASYLWFNELSAQGGRVPSTGFYAVLSAMLMCEHVSLYAFGDSRDVADHYWYVFSFNFETVWKEKKNYQSGQNLYLFRKFMINILMLWKNLFILQLKKECFYFQV